MKAIKNVNELQIILSKEDNNWQKVIYERTGVILAFFNGNAQLFSNCGRIDIDQDAEYRYISGIDKTEYCKITSIDQLVAYITGMSSYSEFLIDLSCGKFSKSELFWGIYERIILPIDNQTHKDGHICRDWELNSIRCCQNCVYLQMALIDCDSVEFELDITKETTIDDALNQLVDHLNEEIPYYDWLPVQKAVRHNYMVPNTYEELFKELKRAFLCFS